MSQRSVHLTSLQVAFFFDSLLLVGSKLLSLIEAGLKLGLPPLQLCYLSHWAGVLLQKWVLLLQDTTWCKSVQFGGITFCLLGTITTKTVTEKCALNSRGFCLYTSEATPTEPEVYCTSFNWLMVQSSRTAIVFVSGSTLFCKMCSN